MPLSVQFHAGALPSLMWRHMKFEAFAARHSILSQHRCESRKMMNVAHLERTWVKVQVFSAQPPFEQKATLHTGPITPREFCKQSQGQVCLRHHRGANEVKVFSQGCHAGTSRHNNQWASSAGIWPSGMVPGSMLR